MSNLSSNKNRSQSQTQANHSNSDHPARNEPPAAMNAEGEIRSYYVPPHVIRREQQLLTKYKAVDFLDLLNENHNLLVGLVKLMKSTPPDIRLKGYVVASLGHLLGQASSLSKRLCHVYKDVERVEK